MERPDARARPPGQGRMIAWVALRDQAAAEGLEAALIALTRTRFPGRLPGSLTPTECAKLRETLLAWHHVNELTNGPHAGVSGSSREVGDHNVLLTSATPTS